MPSGKHTFSACATSGKKWTSRGAWLAASVKRVTLDLGIEVSPRLGVEIT